MDFYGGFSTFGRIPVGRAFGAPLTSIPLRGEIFNE